MDDEIKQVIPRRWTSGIRKISKLIASLEIIPGKNARKAKTKLAAKKYGITIQTWNSFTTKQKNLINRRYKRGVRGRDALTKGFSESIGIFW